MKPRGKGLMISDYVSKDYHKFYRQNGGSFDITLYTKVLKEVGRILTENISDNKQVIMPNGMGIISLKKYEYFPRIQDGKLRGIIDFGATKKLRDENPDIDPKLLKVYYENEHTLNHIVKVTYNKRFFAFRNKSFFDFKPCRSLNRLVAKNIKDKKLDINKIQLYGKIC